MNIPVYQVDAFSETIFGGNPAAVCPIDSWLKDELMQRIAMENNLSETAFIVKEDAGYYIRWFTPGTEVKLCGHATLASAYVYFNILGYEGDTIIFNSKSGPLKVTREENGRITLDFPSNPPELVSQPFPDIFAGLGIEKAPVYKTSFDYMVLLDSQKDIEALKPNFTLLAKTPCRGIITTAKGDEADFVSRCFYPQSGIDEDPVTGSAHTIMVPYWAEKLNKNKMKAIQLSKRRGHLDCELKGDRVLMSGYGALFMKGQIEI